MNRVVQINPLDLQPSVGVGVALPFTSRTVFTTTYTTREATKANLINFLLTNPGERYLNPTFGAGLSGLLFQQSTQEIVDIVRYKIESGIAQYFPQIDLTSISVDRDVDNNLITISMAYTINNTNIQDQLTINIEG